MPVSAVIVVKDLAMPWSTTTTLGPMPTSKPPVLVSAPSAASRAGLLPAFLVAGEAVWREAVGNGFALDIVGDPHALLGYRLRGIEAGHLTTVMLATMEAAAQVAGPSAIVVNDLGALWSAATERIEREARPSSRAAAGAAP